MTNALRQEQIAKRAADLFKILAHPYRIRILALLADGDCSVTDMVRELGVRPAFVSQQLRILRLGELVEVDRQGSFSRYRLADRGIREMVQALEDCATVVATDRGGRGSAARRREQGRDTRR